MGAYERLVDMFAENCIFYEKYAHEPLYTIEDAVRVSGGSVEENVKTILIKTKNIFFLYVTTGEKRVPLKDLEYAIGEKRLSFANQDDVTSVLGYSFGAVTPIGNDEKIKVLVDKSVQELETIYINPGKNEFTFKLSGRDFFKLLKKYHEYGIVG